MGEQAEDAQKFDIRFDRVLTLTDGRSISAPAEDILIKREGVEVVLARADDGTGSSSGLPVRTILYPWHRVLSVETAGTAVTSHPGGEWSVTFGGEDERRGP
jgi:hypothetical protein